MKRQRKKKHKQTKKQKKNTEQNFQVMRYNILDHEATGKSSD